MTTACWLCIADSPEHPERCGCFCHDHAFTFKLAKTDRLRAERGVKTPEGCW